MEYYGYGRVITSVGGLFGVRMLPAKSELFRTLNGGEAREPMPLDGVLV